MIFWFFASIYLLVVNLTISGFELKCSWKISVVCAIKSMRWMPEYLRQLMEFLDGRGAAKSSAFSFTKSACIIT